MSFFTIDGFNTEHFAHDEHIRQLLQGWKKSIDRYLRNVDKATGQSFGDAPWWYNERTSISVLAGAAWINQWSALEEYSTTKRGAPDENLEKNHRIGRADLMVQTPEVSFAFEAKQAWQRIGTRTATGPRSKNIFKKKKSAWKDVRELSVQEANYRFSATFAAPFFPDSDFEKLLENSGKKPVTAYIKAWYEELHEQLSSRTAGRTHYMAAYFPDPESGLVTSTSGFHYPGAVLILEQCQKGN